MFHNEVANYSKGRHYPKNSTILSNAVARIETTVRLGWETVLGSRGGWQLLLSKSRAALDKGNQNSRDPRNKIRRDRCDQQTGRYFRMSCVAGSKVCAESNRRTMMRGCGHEQSELSSVRLSGTGPRLRRLLCCRANLWLAAGRWLDWAPVALNAPHMDSNA